MWRAIPWRSCTSTPAPGSNGAAARSRRRPVRPGKFSSYACVKGTPAHEIINYADQNALDLIAMATHGRGEVAWVPGSVAEKVVSHATVPVLGIKVPKTKVDLLNLLDRGLP
ncbi:MAG: universal stress protein [Desulfobaccales bacterium]